MDSSRKRGPDETASSAVTPTALDVAAESLISERMRGWLRGVEDRFKSDRPSQCWRCLEWHTDLKEVEMRGWLCRSCRDEN